LHVSPHPAILPSYQHHTRHPWLLFEIKCKKNSTPLYAQTQKKGASARHTRFFPFFFILEKQFPFYQPHFHLHNSFSP
jgi:hypothetical protein